MMKTALRTIFQLAKSRTLTTTSHHGHRLALSAVPKRLLEPVFDFSKTETIEEALVDRVKK